MQRIYPIRNELLSGKLARLPNPSLGNVRGKMTQAISSPTPPERSSGSLLYGKKITSDNIMIIDCSYRNDIIFG